MPKPSPRRREFALEPLSDLVRRGAEGAWAATGPNPQFRLVPPAGRFPVGWALFDSRLQRRGTDYSARLLFELADGGELEVPVPVTLKGTVHELVWFPPGIRGLRWLPMKDAGDIEQAPVFFAELGFFERVYRMLRRIVPMLWLHPRRKLAPLGLVAERLLYDLAGAYFAAGSLRAYAPVVDYGAWLARFERLSAREAKAIQKQIAAWDDPPRFSCLMPLAQAEGLGLSVDSLRRQLYGHWELCVVALDGETARQARAVLGGQGRVLDGTGLSWAQALNLGLAAARGSHVACLDAGDELAPTALYQIALALRGTLDALAVYSDEDRIDAEGLRHSPSLKPAWSPDLFEAQDYLGRLLALPAQAAREAGGFAAGREGFESYDLLLRCLKSWPQRPVVHVPALLYHRRDGMARKRDGVAGLAALRAYFGPASGVRVEPGLLAETFHVLHPLPEPAPKVALIVPTKDRFDLLHACVESVLARTAYVDFEVLVVDNQSEEADALAYLRELAGRPGVRVLSYPHPFNYSAINNLAVRQTDAALVCLLNNDVEVIAPAWLEEMVRHAVRPEVGAVGAKLCHGDGRVQHAGVALGVGGVAAHVHQYFPRESAGYTGRLAVTQNFSAVTGACLLLRREVFEAVGGLDEENLKVAYNDVDLCLKIRRAGYRIVWTPYAELYHHESASRGRDDTPEKRRLQKAEADFMRRRWRAELPNDPYYNPWLTMKRKEFTLSETPDPERMWRVGSRVLPR